MLFSLTILSPSDVSSRSDKRRFASEIVVSASSAVRTLLDGDVLHYPLREEEHSDARKHDNAEIGQNQPNAYAHARNLWKGLSEKHPYVSNDNGAHHRGCELAGLSQRRLSPSICRWPNQRPTMTASLLHAMTRMG